MSERGETLTDSMLDGLPAHLRPIREGKYLRAGCPFHGSDKQRSLSLDTETGRFQCFSCGIWGYTEAAREAWKAQHGGRAIPPVKPWARSSGTVRMRADAAEPEPLPDEMLQELKQWQAALPEAAEYLEGRRIPLELVRAIWAEVSAHSAMPAA